MVQNPNRFSKIIVLSHPLLYILEKSAENLTFSMQEKSWLKNKKYINNNYSEYYRKVW